MEIPVEATGEADPLTGDPEVDVAAVIGEAVAAGVTAGAVGGLSLPSAWDRHRNYRRMPRGSPPIVR